MDHQPSIPEKVAESIQTLKSFCRGYSDCYSCPFCENTSDFITQNLCPIVRILNIRVETKIEIKKTYSVMTLH